MAERERKAEDKREVVLADGKPVLRDLAAVDEAHKKRQKQWQIDSRREEKLREIGFPFHNRKNPKSRLQ